MLRRACVRLRLIGPSVESVFLACHKYYSRQNDPGAIPFQALNIREYDLTQLKIGYPCYVKAPCLMCSHLQYIVKDEAEMEEVLAVMRDQLQGWGKMFFDFFENYISKSKYPLAHQEIVVVEELMVDFKQCVVEGWVDRQGNVNTWVISDINYHEFQRQSQNCYTMPTVTLAELQNQMVALATQTVLNHGIRSGFFNIDIWHWSGQRPSKIIEVNGRAASLYHRMHKRCFNTDLYKAMLHLCLGEDAACYAESPIQKLAVRDRPIVGGLFFVVTFGKGAASKYLDFENVARMQSDSEVEGMELFVDPDFEIEDNGTAGFRMAKFYIFGSSFEEINTRAQYWRDLIVKQKQESPYSVGIFTAHGSLPAPPAAAVDALQQPAH